MRGKVLILIGCALIAAALPASGCGGGGKDRLDPRLQGLENTLEGNYQVKGIEDGQVQGVGIYDGGSFRIVQEGTPRVVIHNEESGENWLVNLSEKTYKAITYDDALAKAGFMPHVAMVPYLELEDHWTGDEFRMDAPDGRSIRAYLGGQGYLPSTWWAETAEGEIFTELIWEYSRVGQVSRENFVIPEGLTQS